MLKGGGSRGCRQNIRQNKVEEFECDWQAKRAGFFPFCVTNTMARNQHRHIELSASELRILTEQKITTKSHSPLF